MNTLRRAYHWLLFAPALLPLVFAAGLIYPFATPKTLLLWSLGIVALALFVFLAAAGEEFFWPRLKNYYTWLPAALLAVAYGTSLIGVDFYRSFWGVFSRGDGLFTFTVITLFFYLILLAVDRRFFLTLCTLLAWVGSLVALYGLLQWIKVVTGIDLPVIADTGARVGSTLDNAAFLAAYLSLTLFATLATAPERRGRWRTLWYAGAALQLVVVMLTATRGSIVALGVALVAVLAYISWRGWPSRKDSQSLQRYARWSLGALVVLAALFFFGRGELSRLPIAPVQRIASISTNDVTVASRLFIWQNVGALALQKSLTGYGAEHIAVPFDQVYDPSKIIEQWFDRTHNSFLDYFVQYGVFGLLLYIGVVLRLAYLGWRLFARGGSSAGEAGRSGAYLLLIVLAYSVQNFFVFDTSVTLWILFAFLAAGEVLADEGAPATAPLRVPGANMLGGAVAIILLALLYPVVLLPLRANLSLFDAYSNQVSDVGQEVSSLQSGFALGTFADLEYGYQAYSMYTGVQLTALKGDDLVTAYTEAEAVLEADYDRYPYDARTALYLAQVMASAPPGVSIDQTKFSAVLERSIALSPKRSQAWYIKANVYISEGDSAKTAAAKQAAYAQALDILKQYSALVPALAEPRYVIATLYLTSGDTASAAQWAAEGLAVYSNESQAAQRAATYYINVQDWAHAERFLDDVVKDDPTHYDSAYDLAKVSYLAGDKAKALAIVQQLQQEDPALVQSDPAFLQALGQQ